MDYKQVGTRTLRQINADNMRAHGIKNADAVSDVQDALHDGDKVYILYNGGMDPVIIVNAGAEKSVIKYSDGKTRTVKNKFLKPASEVSKEAKQLYGKHIDAAPGSVNLSPDALRRRNMAIEWAQEHADDYPNAQQLAQAASTKYDVQMDLIQSSLSGLKFSRDAKNDRPTEVFGYKLDAQGRPIKEFLKPREPGKDYGADPLGDGKFRMVPSGDIVDLEERNRRLGK